MEIYLTDNIRLKNDNMEYRCKNDKFKPITKNNWHFKLNEYGLFKKSGSEFLPVKNIPYLFRGYQY